MLKFFVVLGLLAVASGEKSLMISAKKESPTMTTNYSEGAAVSLEDRFEKAEYIVGGKPTKIEEVPYQAALLIGKEERFYCGASVLSETHVLTAAHCIFGIHPENMYASVRLGVTDRTKGGQKIHAKKIVVHPKFTMLAMEYDVAVIELASPVKFSATSKAIKIADKMPADGESVIVSGWGSLKENGTFPTTLYSATVKIVNRTKCAKDYKGYYTVTEKMLCAADKGKDSCNADSGGPLAYKGDLIGVVSFGLGCARENYPGVYANLIDPEIRKFIKENSGI